MTVVTYFPGSIDVYTKDFVWVGNIGNPISINGTVVFNGLSTFTVEVSASDPIVSDLLEYGARVTMVYRDAQLFSGMITEVSGALVRNGSITVTLMSDWRLLQNTLAWIAPTQALEPTALSVKNVANVNALGQAHLPGGSTTQGTSGSVIGQVGYYQWSPSVVYAETALKTLITENLVTRLARPVTVAADLNRGGDIKTPGLLPEVRMARLEDVCQRILSLDGLGLKLEQATRTSTITADVFEPGVWDMPLTVDSGVVAGGSWSVMSPTTTRIVLGGAGELAARHFVGALDATGLEAEWGDVVEVFRDATSASDLEWPENLDDSQQVPKYYELRSDVAAGLKTKYRASLVAAGKLGLEEGLPKFGINAQLSETEAFHFGGSDGVQLGDLVTIQGVTGALYTDRITECSFNFGNGVFEVIPVVGIRTDDPDRQLAQAIATLATAQRRISKDR
jgi:hypothetical protein